MTLRLASAADQDFLWDMLLAAIYLPPGADPFPRALVHEDPLARYARDFGQQPGDLGVIFEIDGSAVGAAWIRLFLPGAEGFGSVDASTPELSIAVDERYRGRGFGTSMMRDLLYRARQAGVKQISLSCDPANPAWRLYERLGFLPRTPGDHTMVLRLG